MAKLGAFLLRGLGRKRKKVRAFTSVSAPRKRLKKALKKNPAKSNPQQELSPVTRRRVLTLPQVTVAPAPEAHGLMSSDLLKPDDRLRKSIDAFLRDQRSEHTRRAYGKDLKRFLKYLIERKFRLGPEALDRSVIIGYKDFLLGEKLEHTTVDRHLATLRSFFRWLVEDGLVQKSPAENVRFLNPKKTSSTIGFTDAEVTQLLKMPDLYTRSGALHYAVLMVLFYCGLRRSELCELRTSNLGFERGHHFFRLRGKGNAERIVVLVEPVWTAIQYYLKMVHKDLGGKSNDGPLFTPIRNNRTGIREKPIDSSMIFYIVTRYAKLAGITNRVSPHSCRATAISNARDHNVPDRVIQEFAGWSTTTMITRYDKRKSALDKSAAHSIDYGDKERPLPVIIRK